MATSNDPYSSPASDLSSGIEQIEYNDSGMFSFSGRIGRLRYLAYPLTLYLFTSLVIAALGAISGNGYVFDDTENSGSIIILILMVVIYIVLFIYVFVYGVRRLNDIGWSGFLSILYIIPLINFIFGLLLLFMPGDTESNKYGAPPPPNTLGIKIMAFFMPMIAIIGILAAIAIPAYQDYVERAAQSQQ